MKRLSNDEFIRKAEEIHKGKYSYEKVKYTRSSDKVIITCRIHGDFEQSAGNHLAGYGCSTCAKDSLRLTKEDFINRANNKYKNFYSYDLVPDFKSTKTRVAIVCPFHGVFYNTVANHLKGSCCIFFVK